MPEAIEIIRNRTEAYRLAQNLIKSAEKEILAIFSSSANTFMRQSNERLEWINAFLQEFKY